MGIFGCGTPDTEASELLLLQKMFGRPQRLYYVVFLLYFLPIQGMVKNTGLL